MRKETFILRTEWAEDLELMTMTERGELLTMLFEHASSGENTTETSKIAQLAFRQWKRFIDACDARWDDVREERSKAGKASAEARKRKKTAENEQNPTEGNKAQQSATNLTSVDFVETCCEQNPTEGEQSATEGNLSESVSVSVNNNTTPPTPSPEMPKPSTNDPVLAEVMDYFGKKISWDMSPATRTQLIAACAEWPADVVCSAIDAALDAGKRNANYVIAVLRGYRQDGVKTMADVRRRDEERRAERNNGPGVGGSGKQVPRKTDYSDTGGIPGLTVLG